MLCAAVCQVGNWGQFLTVHFIRLIKRERGQNQELPPPASLFHGPVDAAVRFSASHQSDDSCMFSP
jgi:hypothetical protein